MVVRSAGSEIMCRGEVATIVGTPGEDVLRGTPSADVIVGLGRADRIRGAGGDDVMCGNAGDDALRGGAGDDRLIGGLDSPFEDSESSDPIPGADRLRGGGGDDRLEGGNDRGTDRLYFSNSRHGVRVDLRLHTASGQGSDTVFGVEWVTGSTHADVLRGGHDRTESVVLYGLAGRDRLVGSPRGGATVLIAGAGDDLVLAASNDYGLGNGGADVMGARPEPRCSTSLSGGCVTLIGGPGDDRLTGSYGDDELVGDFLDERGADILRGRAGRDSVDGGPGPDQMWGGAAPTR